MEKSSSGSGRKGGAGTLDRWEGRDWVVKTPRRAEPRLTCVTEYIMIRTAERSKILGVHLASNPSGGRSRLCLLM